MIHSTLSHSLYTYLSARSFVVCDRFKIVSCLNWKTGSSTWQWVFLNNTAPQPLPYDPRPDWEDTVDEAKRTQRMVPLHLYSPAEIRDRLKNYFKFLTVRHPLDRLVSTYVDKLVNHA